MLADIATANLLNRPRPPGSRRSSNNKVEKLKRTEEEQRDAEQDENQTPPSLTPLARSPPDSKQMVMERDLELDLPVDFTAALQRNSRYWPQARNLSSPATHNGGDPSLAADTEVHQSLGGSLGRVHLANVRRSSTDDVFIDRSSGSGRRALDSLFQPQEEHVEEEPDSPYPSNEEQRQRRSSLESEQSMDSEWVGDLPREELETLLMQANRVIKERERDLGIAAAIGKALLEKNISLRSKHEGIMSRLSSVNSFPQFTTSEEDSISQALTGYSPPNTDSGSANGLEDVTPRPTPRGQEYFEDFAGPPQSPKTTSSMQQQTRYTSPNKKEGPSPAYWTATEDGKRDSWRSEKDCFVPSIPPSPASVRQQANQDRSQGQLQFSHETQRQLETLSEQNEALLEQLSQLQAEAEEAKKLGGKRLKKLNREIGGLRTELEAATERNVELEKEVADEEHAGVGDMDSSGRVRRVWKRRGASWKATENDGDDSLRSSSSTVRNVNEATGSEASSIRSHKRDESGSESTSGLPRSESSFSTATGKIAREPERALVAQLMAKIRELEETNAVLALAGTEMDGRIGKAMEEGERIRDAYEAVENVAAFEESLMKREDSDLLETQYTGSPYSLSSVSPSGQQSRRAPGNRYIIEGRKTLRAALQDQEEDYDNSNDSSLTHSPVPVKGRGMRLRPRILITPSSEDLRASAMQDSIAGWRDSHGQEHSFQGGHDFMTSTPIKRGHRYGQFDSDPEVPGVDDLASLHTIHSATNFPYSGRRSLGSELGSVFGGEEERGNLRTDDPLKLTDLQRRESIGSITLRSRASLNSLRAPSEAESDIADLKWSIGSGSTMQAFDSMAREADETIKQVALITTSAQTPTPASFDQIEDGSWLAVQHHEVVPKGSLKNEMESTHESYEWLEHVTKKLPLQWADDDDFGKPITEKEARQLGLLQVTSSKEQKKRGLLSWVQKKGGKKEAEKGKMKEKIQIESRESVEEREKLAALLREKRVVALQKRVLSGHISADRARQKGIFGQEVTEGEITARAFAYNTARRRKLKATEQWPEQVKGGSHQEEKQSSPVSDEDFELLNLDPSKRRPGRKGTDYYPITIRERYKPTVVKQRAKQYSNEALTWASTWATFSLVMVFAFIVTFSRGPKKVLNGQHQKYPAK